MSSRKAASVIHPVWAVWVNSSPSDVVVGDGVIVPPASPIDGTACKLIVTGSERLLLTSVATTEMVRLPSSLGV